MVSNIFTSCSFGREREKGSSMPEITYDKKTTTTLRDLGYVN